MCTGRKILRLLRSWASITTHCVAVGRACLYKLYLTIFCMQIISSMWPTQKQLQHAYDLGNQNYSYWSALFKSLCSLRAVSLDTVGFCGVGAERQAYPCLGDMEVVLMLQSSSFWSFLQCNVCIKCYQTLITETNVFPQAWTNPPRPFSAMPASLLCLTKTL